MFMRRRIENNVHNQHIVTCPHTKFHQHDQDSLNYFWVISGYIFQRTVVQTDIQTDRQTDNQTDRGTNKQTDDKHIIASGVNTSSGLIKDNKPFESRLSSLTIVVDCSISIVEHIQCQVTLFVNSDTTNHIEGSVRNSYNWIKHRHK